MALPIPSHEVNARVQRTAKGKIAVDEEFRRKPLQSLETRKWVSTASQFFERHFGLAFQISEFESWSSDNSKNALSGLIQDLYKEIGRGKAISCSGSLGRSAAIQRTEADVPLMLTLIYTEMKDYEKALRECLEAEKIAPRDPMIKELLRLASQRQ